MTKRVHKIGKVLRRTLRRMDLDTKLEGYRIWSLWDDIVGEQIARRAQPDRLRNRILFVRVSSSTWMQQLQTMKPTLMEKIHKVVSDGAVKDVRFSLGEVIPPSQDPPRLGSENEEEETKLSAEMEEYLKQVRDRELKSLMRSIMLKQAEKMMGPVDE